MFIDLEEKDLLHQFPDEDDPRWMIAVVEYGGLAVWQQPNRESRIKCRLSTYAAYWVIYQPRTHWLPVRWRGGYGYVEQKQRICYKVALTYTWHWRLRKEIKVARNMIALLIDYRLKQLDKLLEHHLPLK